VRERFRLKRRRFASIVLGVSKSGRYISLWKLPPIRVAARHLPLWPPSRPGLCRPIIKRREEPRAPGSFAGGGEGRKTETMGTCLPRALLPLPWETENAASFKGLKEGKEGGPLFTPSLVKCCPYVPTLGPGSLGLVLCRYVLAGPLCSKSPLRCALGGNTRTLVVPSPQKYLWALNSQVFDYIPIGDVRALDLVPSAECR